jgi:iron(III) transport system permease protein
MAVVALSPRPVSLPRGQLVLGLAAFTAIAVVTIAPVLVVVFGAVSGNVWRETIASPLNRSAIGYSLLLALRAPIAALVGFLIAWLVIRIRIPGGRYIEFAMWMSFFVPLLPVTLSWILLLDSHYGLVNRALMALPFVHASPFNIYSVEGILWVHITASSVPVMVVLLGPAIRQFDASFEEIGRICGSRPLAVFFKITLPILAPAILTGALAGFIKSLEAFEVEQLLGRPAGIFVYSTRIYDLASWEPPKFQDAMALSSIVLVILLVMALAYQRVNRRFDYATVLGRGARYQPLSIGPARWLVSGGLWLVVVISLVIPMAMLVLGSCMKLFGFFSIPSPYTLQHWREVLGNPLFSSALWNSLLMSFGAGFGGTAIYSVIAYLIARSRLPGRGIVELLAWLPWSIPGILLGVSVLYLILSSPLLSFLYGSVASLALIITVAQLPIGTHMMKTSMTQIAVELEHSSRVCGAGPVRTFLRIVLPLIRPMLVSIFILVFISAIRDISTIIFLASAQSQTLSLLMMQFGMSSNLEASAVIGVITTAIIVVVALVGRRFGLALTSQR